MSETDVKASEAVLSLDELLAAGTAGDGKRHYHIGSDWMQGRTAYGGISAAAALHSAMVEHPGDAPLRTAQISFIGPVGGECDVTTRMLRQSKSSRFVGADLVSESGYGTNAVFSFMKPRESHVDLEQILPPEIREPDQLECVPEHPARPSFTRKFEMRPVSGRGFGHGKDEALIVTWVKWIDQPACDPHIALLALADALPPAAMTAFHQFGPISSSTWIQHFLTDHPVTTDGWWLLVTRSHHVRRGFSAQDMYIFDADRRLVSMGGQGVALYI
ncbi:thioesterase family protein [Sphingomonas lacunae]|uniref:Thioesterase family protein n=1 Tax=Sphingomonas lacunae TaxID=2698828 RepID=A0A6M4AVY6_9SPHN|nr:thioesterase family protein [Sphingomonas lacunae]QJQ33244.1 thioesterase family protein [Sphingomonas lacunae]